MQTSDEFVDVHCHVFTPDSFLGLLDKLARLDLIDYEVAAFVPTERDNFEFYVSLRRLTLRRGESRCGRRNKRRSRVRAVRPPANGVQPRLALMGVSPAEERLLNLKRRSLARLRATLKRGG